MNTVEKRMLTTTEVMKMLGMQRASVHKLINSKQLKAINIGAGSKCLWKVDAESVEAFVRARSNV